MVTDLQPIPIDSILVLNRQRIDHSNTDGIKESLAEKGTIQPLVLMKQADGTLRLIAGGRRLTFLKELGFTHLYHGSTCVPGKPGYVLSSELPIDTLHELELEENVKRKDMTWQERCLAIADIHALRLKSAALSPTAIRWGQRETAALLNLTSPSTINYNLIISAKLRDEQRTSPDSYSSLPFWSCASLTDALRLQARLEEETLLARLAIASAGAEGKASLKMADASAEHGLEWLDSLGSIDDSAEIESQQGSELDTVDDGLLAQREHILTLRNRARGHGYSEMNEQEQRSLYMANTLNVLTEEAFQTYRSERLAAIEVDKNAARTIDLSSRVFNLSCIDWMTRNPSSVDHIITDPPYGIDMENLDQQNTGMSEIDTVAAEHEVDANKRLLSQFIPAAYTTLKDSGFLIMWCDQSLWQFMYDCAISAGFKVQRWPITWIKLHPCMNQSAYQNFTKSTEIAMVCRKGNATLTTPSSVCHISASHDSYKQQLGHPFVKPFDVWKFLIEHCTMQGQTILEPFAGRGSCPISLARLNRKFIACESNTAHYNALLENLKNYYKSINPEFLFV